MFFISSKFSLPFFLILFFFSVLTGFAQIPIGEDLSSVSYEIPREYELGGLTVSGASHFDPIALGNLAGLTIGEKIMVPGEKITNTLKTLWKQGLFSDIRINATHIQDNKIFLEFVLTESPRLSKFSFTGVRKSEADELRENIKLFAGKVLTDELTTSAQFKVKKYYIEKGFLNCEVDLSRQKDTVSANSESLTINVKKGKRVKINNILFHGNSAFEDIKLMRTMKDTKKKKWYRLFKTSKFVDENFEADKKKLIAKYNENGYRDAKIRKDSVYRFRYSSMINDSLHWFDDKTVNVEITLEEGPKYYFRSVAWVGNTQHTSEELTTILGIKRGDVFNQTLLDTRLFMNPNGRDVSSLYLDDGYLFFSITPVEINVENDSIDMEMRIYEGKQATINRVYVTGNTKTHDHVVMREIRTQPGQLFSRADVIRSQRELAQLGYFDPEKLNVNPKPNPAEGTVDIEYVVEEKSSDMVELSGGWGGGRLVGSFGVSFNNFSAKNFFKGSAWTPLPSGDGQRLSVRAQSTGAYYQSYNMSFTEPWLGGKKPNAMSITFYHSVQTNGLKKTDPKRASLYVSGISVGLGKRLQWPDDYFTMYQQVEYQHYLLKNYSQLFVFSDGNSNNISYNITFARNSLDQPIFPRSGAEVSLSMEATPPWSLFRNVDYNTLSAQDKYKWLEYHKYKLKISWFTKLVGNLVLNTRLQYGFLAYYNSQLGLSPFERFYVGGSGLSGFSLDGREIVALRGYPDWALSSNTGDPIFGKYTFELRYPLSLNPSATIWLLGFLEAGESWENFRKFRPFEVKRAAGAGIRMFLPMFGLLGFDFGYGIDRPLVNQGLERAWEPHFVIGYSIE